MGELSIEDTESTFIGEGAFGDPDGAREDFRRFIPFEAGQAWGGLSTSKEDLSARIIVGAKGSGKTIYKRLLEGAATARGDLYVFPQTLQVPSTELVDKYGAYFSREASSSSNIINTDTVFHFSESIEDNQRTEQWQLLWRRAIFKSLASLFYAKRERILEPAENFISTEEFYDEFEELFGDRAYLTSESIFNQVNDIIFSNSSRSSIQRYLHSNLWESLERVILTNLRANRPVCYFIDAIDEDFRHSPSQWMDCQKGLFYTVMRLLKDPEIINSLHIFICIRDIVFSSVLQSEHGGRFLQSQHVRVLDWGPESASVFLRKKIEGLPSRFFDSPRSRTVENWLGMKSIRNKVRRRHEKIEDYLLRHTRFFPRDINILGNALCKKIEECRAKKTVLSPEDIRQTVGRVSQFIGHEAIRICGNHLAVSSIPVSGQQAFSNVAEEYPVVADWAATNLEDFIRCIGKDVFSASELRSALKDYQADFSDLAEKTKYMQYRIDTVLWQHGLLGYREHSTRGRCTFYGTSENRPFFLPVDKQQYVFHPCLIDHLGITPVGSYPIGS